MNARVAALYVDPRGPYASMPDVDAWDEKRNARYYFGPHPVVAHPPCGPWGRLKAFCTKQDPTLGPRAVQQVRLYGGVLEHPADSTLFRACQLPFPDELPDAWGGWTLAIDQCAWGHRAKKPTWLYFVGVDRAAVRPRRGGTPSRKLCNNDRPSTQQLQCMGNRERRLTPPHLARWLVGLASTARAPVVAGSAWTFDPRYRPILDARNEEGS